MKKRSGRRSSPWRIAVLILLIGGGIYLNRFVVPNTPQLFVPTPTPTSSPESYLNLALENYNNGKLLPAIEAYKKAIVADPTNQSIYVEMARVQLFAGQYDNALESAERSLVGNDNYAPGHAMRGWALNFLKDYAGAEQAAQRAIALDPNNALAHAVYAEALANRNEFGDIDKAITESNKAISLEPDSLEALRARGYILFVTGNYKEALEKYEAAIRLNKYIPDLHLNVAYCYKALVEENPENLEKAIQSFLQANTLNPQDAIPDLELSRLYLQMGEFEKASQYAENAVNDDPTNPNRYGNLGITYYRKGDYPAAISAFKIAVRGGRADNGSTVTGIPLDYGWPATYYMFYGMALAKVTPNQCSEAVPLFQGLITTVPDDTLAVENAVAGLEICQASAEGREPEPTATP